MTPENVRLQYALKYRGLGWKAIPVHYASPLGVCSCFRGSSCNFAGKHPVPTGWQHSDYDPEALAGWWKENAYYNVGIATGPQSNLVVLDLDAGKGGEQSLKELEDTHGQLPLTPTVLTGGGGKHFYFQYPKDLYIPSRGGFLPGLDVRGVGGQVVAPPSFHKSGQQYKWADGANPSLAPLSLLPSWLKDLLEQKEEVWISEEQGDSEAAEVYYSNCRNVNLFHLGRRLRVVKDISPDELAGMLHLLNKTKCQPPLDPSEVDHIVKNVLRKGGKHVVVDKGKEGTPPKPVRLVTIDSIWAPDSEEVLPYLAPGLLLEGEISLLAAPTEAGKSLVAMSMAISIASGKRVWGRGEPCKPRRVMYCTEELAGRTIRNRIRKMADGMKADRSLLKENLCILPQQNLTLGLRNQANLDSFFYMADQFKPDFVILDTYISYYGGEEKSSEDNRAWFNGVPIALRAQFGCAVMIQHHAKKPQLEDGKKTHYHSMSDLDLMHSIRGTSDLPGVCERVWFMWKTKEERDDFGPLLNITLRNVKAREGDKSPTLNLFVRDSNKDSTIITASVLDKSKRHREMEAILHKVLPPDGRMAKGELSSGLMVAGKKSKSVCYEWIDRFYNEGTLEKTAEGLYFFNKDSEELPD